MHAQGDEAALAVAGVDGRTKPPLSVRVNATK
jgi:hypothetical protein